MEDDAIKDDELSGERDLEEGSLDEEIPKKPKSLLDDENVESLDDAVDEELEIDKEDLMDDVDDM